MTDHPITPPPELVHEWEAAATISREATSSWTEAFATRAAQWGADKELDACCEWLDQKVLLQHQSDVVPALRAARRSKTPSLKELALHALSEAVKMADDVPPEGICSGQADIIRRALEQLDD
jgi:tetrahydrodipicolinate N-succinyltransferase